jgi:hypothetical protein
VKVTRQTVTTKTQSVTCLGNGSHQREKQHGREGLRAKEIQHRQVTTSNSSSTSSPSLGTLYAPPNCGDVVTTTIKALVVETTTSTVTDVPTSYKTTTMLTFNAPVRTIYSSVHVTTRITPTMTRTTYTVARASTTTITRVYTVTQTVYPYGKWMKQCPR